MNSSLQVSLPRLGSVEGLFYAHSHHYVIHELISKNIINSIDERSLTTVEETRYTDNLMERLVSSTVPTSDTVATATVIDGGNWSFTRNYNEKSELTAAQLGSDNYKTPDGMEGLPAGRAPNGVGTSQHVPPHMEEGYGERQCQSPRNLRLPQLFTNRLYRPTRSKRRTLHHMGSNPADAHWINRDSIGLRGGLNLYGFAGNRGCSTDILSNYYTPQFDMVSVNIGKDCTYKSTKREFWHIVYLVGNPRFIISESLHKCVSITENKK